MHGITNIWQSQASVSINSCLTFEGLLKKFITEEVPCGFFLRTVIVNRGNSCELKPKKNVLVLRQWADLYQFSKVSKRTNPEWNFKIFTFASQRRLLELLSYGEYNHVYFSVTCFLKTTHLSVIAFSHSFFVSYFEENVRLHHFSEVEKYWLQLHRFKTLNNINVNNFSLGDPCCEINFGKTKSLKIARSFCAKVF